MVAVSESLSFTETLLSGRIEGLSEGLGAVCPADWVVCPVAEGRPDCGDPDCWAPAVAARLQERTKAESRRRLRIGGDKPFAVCIPCRRPAQAAHPKSTPKDVLLCSSAGLLTAVRAAVLDRRAVSSTHSGHNHHGRCKAHLLKIFKVISRRLSIIKMQP